MAAQPKNGVDAKVDGDLCRVSGVIDFDTAPSLMSIVAEHIESEKSVTVDFSAVTHANSAALALLLEWKTHATKHDCAFNHQYLPESIRQLSEICQVSELI